MEPRAVRVGRCVSGGARYSGHGGPRFDTSDRVGSTRSSSLTSTSSCTLTAPTPRACAIPAVARGRPERRPSLRDLRSGPERLHPSGDAPPDLRPAEPLGQALAFAKQLRSLPNCRGHARGAPLGDLHAPLRGGGEQGESGGGRLSCRAGDRVGMRVDHDRSGLQPLSRPSLEASPTAGLIRVFRSGAVRAISEGPTAVSPRR